MKTIIKLLAIIFFVLIYSCEKYEDEIKISIDIEISSIVDTIYTNDSEIPLISSQSWKLNDLCKIKILYVNKNSDPLYNEGADYYIGKDTTCNGEQGIVGSTGPQGSKGDPGHNGNDGQNGNSPEITIIKKPYDLCKIYEFYSDSKLLLRDTICSGQTGPIGPIGPQGPKGDKGDSDTIVKITKIVVYDTIFNMISSIDTLWISDSIFILESHTDTILRIDSVFIYSIDTIVCIKSRNNFRETIIKEGPIKLYKCDTIWFKDLFSDNKFSIEKLSFIGGNKKGADLEIFGKDKLGNIYSLYNFYWNPIPNFHYLFPERGILYFEGNIDSSINISSIGVLAKYSLPLCERNDYIHLSNIKITGVKTIEE